MAEPAAPTGSERMLAATTDRLARIHRAQVHRDPWPEFERFDSAPWPSEQRRAAAVQWAGRARAEYGSIQQFSGVAHVLTTARIELELLGSLARLITDEVRHAELCAAMALAIWPEGRTLEPHVFGFPRPREPWRPAPPFVAADELAEPQLAWVAGALLTACCLGETLSRPMLDALVVVTTDPIAEAVSQQIRRDEHLHATFGWDALAHLLPRLAAESRVALQRQLADDFAGFERSVCRGIDITAMAGREITIERDQPNLGVLTDEQYAMIFFATVEGEIFPQLRELGLDPERAWAERARAG
ncbi:hypothetical protein ACNOYE_03060 [Nannocystaceae bacterium ST9]